MAFDQITRNRLNRFVADARKLLANEFTRQLQAIYAMNPVTGDVADIKTLMGLTPNQQESAQLLRDTFEHYLVNSEKGKEKERKLAALDRIVREQAFTVLNRMAALRMSEARGFLIESIANGYESKGFQLFHRIAGTSLGETGDAYRHYLFSIFDEFSLDLSVLFDRFSIQGRLFPSTPVLIELLTLVNDEEVALLWAEDETIGWIYQYFNSQEERKKMRDASKTPRNSRELAVRNQFFTPRYVVEFLTDNTLGRIWYEMTQGKTKLVEECEYLVRRASEIFLMQDEQAPEVETPENLSQEDLLKQTIYIEHRKLKDPRDIRMLDPACGSMHFGLYCFDLFERIYEEAWDIEITQGVGAFTREADKQPITETYSDKTEFLSHVPRLIIENNIHGVDIDARAVQVAGLSLWQRAHNSWQQAGIKPQQRPKILKSNIVCAEPMPGEKELLQEFTSQLNPTVLGQLVEVIFEKMQLAGEAGTLLKIEKEIEEAITDAKMVWLQQNEALNQFPDLAKIAKNRGKIDFDVSDIKDEGFWQQAEEKILDALAMYASSASAQISGQKILFASDAAKGFAFIDLSKKRFDVVLMNPPFGDPSIGSIKYLESNYPTSKSDLLSAFVDFGLSKIDDGYLGAITARTAFYLVSLSSWREMLLKESTPFIFNDLGYGVMDDALVNAAAYCFQKSKTLSSNSKENLYLRLLDEDSKEEKTKTAITSIHKAKNNKSLFLKRSECFQNIPGTPFAYWLHNSLISVFSDNDTYIESDELRDSKCGLGTLDDFRFIRLRWEIVTPNGWSTYISGGEYSPFIENLSAIVNWTANGREVKVFVEKKVGSASRKVQSEKLYFKPGFTFPRRTRGFSPKLMPKNAIFSTAGQAGFADESDLPWVISMMSSTVIGYLISLSQGSSAIGGGSDPQFEVGLVKRVPWKEPSNEQKAELSDYFFEICNIKLQWLQKIETSEWHKTIGSGLSDCTFLEFYKSLKDELEHSRMKVRSFNNKINMLVSNLYGLGENQWEILIQDLADEILPEPNADYFGDALLDKDAFSIKKLAEKLLSELFGKQFQRFQHSSVNEVLLNTSNVTDNRSDLHSRMVEKTINNHTIGIINSERLTGIVEGKISQQNIYEMLTILKAKSLSQYFTNSNCFFDAHIKEYTSNRRAAPLYWQLQTLSGSITLWVYYHKLNNQTLLSCINDHIEPKINSIILELTTLNNDKKRNSFDDKKIDELSEHKIELEDFSNELLRLAKFWQPNLNDGVQISAAPLWRLFQHKAWQKKLKKTWDKLKDGDYDWAHLAYTTWPVRVLKKCHADRSLAIAHDVENELWHEVEVNKTRKKEPIWEWQPKPLSDSELRIYIKDKISTDERLKLYRSNNTNANGGA